MAQPITILICDDLIDGSRVTATARSLGYEMRQVRTLDQAIQLAEGHDITCVLIDLQTCPDVGLAIDRFSTVPRLPRMVGYGPHVAAELLRKAREAGCDPVLPRSKFFDELDEHLKNWLGEAENSSEP